MRFKIALAAAGAALMVAAAPARADITYFNGGTSTSSAGTIALGAGFETGTTGTGTVGNVRTYNNGPITITATAISLATSTSAFASANLGYHGSAGIAVCNSGEGGAGCSTAAPNPDHQADNSGGKDFILLRFNAAVTLNEILVKTFSSVVPGVSGDTDVTYYLGNTNPNETLIGQTLANLTGLGFSTTGTDTSNGTGTCATCNSVTPGLSGKFNAVLIGAPPGQSDDAWKLQFVSYTAGTSTTPGGVPEPMSMALLATGLIGLGVASRRRRAA